MYDILRYPNFVKDSFPISLGADVAFRIIQWTAPYVAMLLKWSCVVLEICEV